MPNVVTGKYALALRRYDGIRGLLSQYRVSHLVGAAIRELWEAAGMWILHFCKLNPVARYGWLEALLSPTADYWLRYNAVIEALRKAEANVPGTIVEVSSGGWGGLAWALPRRERDICLIDWSPSLLADRRGIRALRVCANGSQLPFADNSFNTAISLDTLEHLPVPARASFLEELKRIAKNNVIVTCPLQSDDGMFTARDLDLRLAEQILAKQRKLPGWLDEHLRQQHPQKDEIEALLPGTQVTGFENSNHWYSFAVLAQRRFSWLPAAQLYASSAPNESTKPPFRRGLFVWNKPVPVVDGQSTNQQTEI